MLTNASISATILPRTMAEVAGCISTVSGLAIAGPGKGSLPKDTLAAKLCILGLCRICTGLSSNRMECTVGRVL